MKYLYTIISVSGFYKIKNQILKNIVVINIVTLLF